jgi:hypothetical protein
MNSFFTKLSLAALGVFVFNAAQASEFFLKINRSGQHTALVGDQYQTNSSNVYRFFDLPAGTVSVKISDGNTGNLVFDGTITLQQNERLVAELNSSGGMSTVTSTTVTYANWYTENGSGASTTYNQNTPPHPPPPAPDNSGMSPEKFKEIKKTIDAQIADNYKVEKAKSIIKKNAMTSKQIAEICRLMDFDNYKLDFAKFAFDYCVDKSNYYEISSVFSFSSYSEELDKYVDGKN